MQKLPERRLDADGFDWVLLRSFLAIHRAGTVAGAARRLKLQQSTLSRHLTELEEQLAQPLFERTGRGLHPTDAARIVADFAQDMESLAHKMALSLTAKSALLTGTVRVTASQPVAAQLMPPLLAQMRGALPDIQVELVSSNQVSNLLRREADIAVRMVRPEQDSLVAKKIGSVVMGAYAHRGYLARRAAIRHPADLLQHDLIGDDADTAILRGFQSMGYPVGPEAFALRTDDLIVQWQAVRAGFGVGFVADFMARTEPDVRPVLQGLLPIPDLPMWLAVHREIRTNRRIRAVYDFLADQLPSLL